MNFNNKKIGIWGFGIVGNSALSYLRNRGTPQLQVLDKKELSAPDQQLLAQHNIPFLLQTTDLPHFLEYNDHILVSPGIDLRPYQNYQHKWLSELDLFAQEYHHPIIAITGTIGKTSITHLLGQLLNFAGLSTAVGGNIGVGMLNLLATPCNAALLELSSFQLELTNTFAPDLAIWTNFHPNHLDRHSSADDYFNAKFRLLALQQSHQTCLVPLDLAKQLNSTHQVASQRAFFAVNPPHEQLKHITDRDRLYYIRDGHIWLRHHNQTTALLALDQIPAISYQENWLIICSALHIRNLPLNVITTYAAQLNLPEHRLEKVATSQNIAIYNDSKSTTPQATLAAIAQLHGKPIHLLLGGVSKGIDRSPLIAELRNKVHHIYLFGKEASLLATFCAHHHIPHSTYDNLDMAVAACARQIKSGHQMLFSPAGASFDLFENYMQRGITFKQLVARYLP